LLTAGREPDNARMSAAQHPNWLRTVLKEHPALLVSLVYVAASAVGMFYSWDYLRRFGINVFHFAQVGDFLLGSLKEPFTWLVVIAASAVVSFDSWFSRRCEKRGAARWLRWYANARYRSMNYLVVVVITLLLLDLLATSNARATLSGKGQRVEVTLADGSAAKTATLLGTTGQFLFLFDGSAGRVTIHPHESVVSINLVMPVVAEVRSPQLPTSR
jgi:hypothetical protein